MKLPRKLKKEKDKIKVYFYIRTQKKEVTILPKVKINKWTLRFTLKIKAEIKKNQEIIWEDLCKNFLNPNKLNKEVSFSFKNEI